MCAFDQILEHVSLVSTSTLFSVQAERLYILVDTACQKTSKGMLVYI